MQCWTFYRTRKVAVIKWSAYDDTTGFYSYFTSMERSGAEEEGGPVAYELELGPFLRPKDSTTFTNL